MPTKKPNTKKPKPAATKDAKPKRSHHKKNVTTEIVAAKPIEIFETESKVLFIIQKHIVHTPVGLTFDGQETFEEWQEAYHFYSALREKSKWMIGDVLRAGERFGERYAQAVDLTGHSYSYLTTIVSVCSRFSDMKRRRASLSFSAHEACAYLPEQTADHILDQAERLNWDREMIRDAAAKAKGLPTKAEKAAAKAAKKEGGVNVTAASGKPPETIDVQSEVQPRKEGDEPCAQNTQPEEQSSKNSEENESKSTSVPSPATQPSDPVDAANTEPSPAAQDDRQQPPETPAAPLSQPKPLDQHGANETAQARLLHFIEAMEELDVSAMTNLQKRGWLKKLERVDIFIDKLQGSKAAPRK